MVDQAVERILQGVSSPQLQTVPTSDLLPTSRTINKEHRKEKKEKSRACKDLRKKMRRERKCGGNLVSSSTEGDAEADALIEKSGKSTLFKRKSVRLVSVAPVSASPQPCSAENVEPGLTECTATANVTDKVLNSESDCAGDEVLYVLVTFNIAMRILIWLCPDYYIGLYDGLASEHHRSGFDSGH